MMAKPLPGPKDAYTGGESAIFNAENLLESSEVVAERGNFGAAVALIVLGVEEAVKARALFGLLLASKIGEPFGLDDKDFRDVMFHNHALRHSLAFLQEMSDVTRTILLTGIWPRDERDRETVKYDLDMRRWLTQANAMKLRGLYVDFEEGRWREPKDVKPEEWKEALTIARRFVGETRRQQGVAKSI